VAKDALNKPSGQTGAADRDGLQGARLAVATAASLLLTACASDPKTLYAWGDYPDHIYHYLKGEDAGYHEAIQALEEHARMADADRRDLPPGFRAHLGLLYLKNGQPDKAVGYFQEEKAAFPESGPFMDFQLKAFQDADDTVEKAPQ